MVFCKTCNCNFRRPPGFGRVIDVANGNGRSGSIIEVFVKDIGGFGKRKFCKASSRWAVNISIRKVFVPAALL